MRGGDKQEALSFVCGRENWGKTASFPPFIARALLESRSQMLRAVWARDYNKSSTPTQRRTCARTHM